MYIYIDVNTVGLFFEVILDFSLKYEIEKRISKTECGVSEIERSAGLKPGTLRNILLGRSKNPTISVVVALAKTLGCTIEELVGIETRDDAISKEESKDNSPANIALLRQVSNYLFDNIAKIDPSPSLQEVKDYILDMYSYFNSTGKNEIDRNFCDWYIQKIMR